MPQSCISAMLHCDWLVCLQRTQRKGVELADLITFHPLCTVWSKVPSVVQEVWSLEASKTDPSVQLTVLAQLRKGKKRMRSMRACRPCPMSMLIQQDWLGEPQIVVRMPSKAAVALLILAGWSLVRTKRELSMRADLARLKAVWVETVRKGGTLQVTAVAEQELMVPTSELTVMQLEGDRLFPVTVNKPPEKPLDWLVAATPLATDTFTALLTWQQPLGVSATMEQDPEGRTAVKLQTLVVVSTVQFPMLTMQPGFMVETSESSVTLTVVIERESVLVKVMVEEVPGVRALPAGQSIAGVRLCWQRYEDCVAPKGPLKTMQTWRLWGAGGRASLRVLPEQQEITWTGQLAPVELCTRMLQPLPSAAGQPEPPEKVTMLPATDPPELQLGVPIAQLMASLSPLLSPISFRTRTRQLPEGTLLGTVNLVLLLVQLMPGAVQTSELLVAQARLTLQEAEEARKLVPVSVSVTALAEAAEEEERQGLLALLEQEKLQLSPGQLLNWQSLVETTTRCPSPTVQVELIGGVRQVICVLVIVSMLQNQFSRSPTQTSVSLYAGEKLVPVMVSSVPPLQLPLLGETEVMLQRYWNWSTPGLAMLSPVKSGRVTWTVKVPGRPPESPTSTLLSLTDSTFSWYTLPEEFERNTCTAVLLVPKPEPTICRRPLMAGFCEVGEMELMVGAETEPLVQEKVLVVSVRAPTFTETVWLPMVEQAGMQTRICWLVELTIVALLPQTCTETCILSRGKPLPRMQLQQPPLLPPVVVVNWLTTSGTAIAETPVSSPAMPMGSMKTTGVTGPATSSGVPSLLLASLHERAAGVEALAMVQGFPWTVILIEERSMVRLEGVVARASQMVVPFCEREVILTLSQKLYPQLPVQMEGTPLVVSCTLGWLLKVLKKRQSRGLKVTAVEKGRRTVRAMVGVVEPPLSPEPLTVGLGTGPLTPIYLMIHVLVQPAPSSKFCSTTTFSQPTMLLINFWISLPVASKGMSLNCTPPMEREKLPVMSGEWALPTVLINVPVQLMGVTMKFSVEKVVLLRRQREAVQSILAAPAVVLMVLLLSSQMVLTTEVLYLLKELKVLSALKKAEASHPQATVVFTLQMMSPSAFVLTRRKLMLPEVPPTMLQVTVQGSTVLLVTIFCTSQLWKGRAGLLFGTSTSTLKYPPPTQLMWQASMQQLFSASSVMLPSPCGESSKQKLPQFG